MPDRWACNDCVKFVSCTCIRTAHTAYIMPHLGPHRRPLKLQSTIMSVSLWPICILRWTSSDLMRFRSTSAWLIGVGKESSCIIYQEKVSVLVHIEIFGSTDDNELRWYKKDRRIMCTLFKANYLNTLYSIPELFWAVVCWWRSVCSDVRSHLKLVVVSYSGFL